MTAIIDDLTKDITAVANLTHPYAFVAGGAARYLHDKVEDPPLPSDIDLFLREADLLEVVNDRLLRAGYRHGPTQGNAESFKRKGHLPVQLVHPVLTQWTKSYGMPAQVVRHFGFTTEQFWVYGDPFHFEVCGSEQAILDTNARTLRLSGHLTCPVAYAWRANKYGRKGYTMSLRETLVLFQEWSSRPEEWRTQVIATANNSSNLDLYRLLSMD